MKKIIFILIFGILLLFLFQMQIISSSASSDNYSVGSYSTGLASGSSSSPEYVSSFAFNYQQQVGQGQNSNYSSDIGSLLSVGCGDGICNNGETCSTCLADCGCNSGYSCVSGFCTASGGITGAVTGGGGAPSCTNDWVCSEWYPQPCPQEGIQKRVCVNKGSCTGLESITPNLNKTCIPAVILPAEPLFDIFVNVPLQSKWTLKGNDIEFSVKLINVGNKTKIDVGFEYLIIDEDSKLIAERKETKAIGEKDEFKIKFTLPDYLTPGIYRVFVQINYDADKTATAGDSFEIVKDKYTVFLRRAVSFLPALSIVIIFLLILLRLLIRRERKPGRKEKIKEKRIIKLEKSKQEVRHSFVKTKRKKKPTRLFKEKTEIIKPALSTEVRRKRKKTEEKLRKKMIEQVRNLK